MIEPTHRMIKDSLSVLSEEPPLSWDEYLPYVRYALNSAIHRSLRVVPLYLFQDIIVTLQLVYYIGKPNMMKMEHMIW